MTVKLAVLGFALSGGSFADAVTTPPASNGIADITQLIIAITGLVAAASALVLGLRQRRAEDPRDKLLELLLKERRGGDDDEPDPESPAPKRRRRRA